MENRTGDLVVTSGGAIAGAILGAKVGASIGLATGGAGMAATVPLGIVCGAVGGLVTNRVSAAIQWATGKSVQALIDRVPTHACKNGHPNPAAAKCCMECGERLSG